MRFLSVSVFITFAVFISSPAKTSPWFVDDFMMDDYSMDYEAMGYTLMPPPPEIESSVSQRLESTLDQTPLAFYSRLATQFSHPASEQLSLVGDGYLDVRWPTDRQSLGDTNMTLRTVLNEATINHETEFASIQAGLQSMTFGTVPGAGVLDVASPDRISVSTDIGGEKVPALSVKSDLRWQSLEVSAFIIPSPESSRPYEPGWHAEPTEEITGKTNRPAAGASTELNLARSELGLYVAHLAPEFPVSFDGDTRHEPYWLLGSSLSYTLGAIGFETELAYKSGLYPAPPASGDQLVPVTTADRRDRLDAAVGLSYDSQVYGNWTSYISVQRWLDDTDLDATEVLDSRMAVAWKERFFDNRQTTRLSAYSSLIEPVLIAVGDFSYDLGDQWQLTLSLTHYAAAEDTAYADLNGDTRALVEAAFSF